MAIVFIRQCPDARREHAMATQSLDDKEAPVREKRFAVPTEAQVWAAIPEVIPWATVAAPHRNGIFLSSKCRGISCAE